MCLYNVICVLIGAFFMVICDTTTDPDRCITRGSSDPDVVKLQYCLVTKRDVKLSCPENKIIILSSLQLAMKNSRTSCTKRVLKSHHDFCCFLQDSDVLYDAHCLQDLWNKEDRSHYQNFAKGVLAKCTNTSQCVLGSQMFANIQKEIPSTSQYSSYFQIVYHCITAPKSPVRLCSSRSFVGRAVHFKGVHLEQTANKTCTCRMTSQTNAKVTIKAVDVRTDNNGLIFTSDGKRKIMSNDHLPMFGFREIISGKRINVSVISTTPKTDDNVWLYASGSNGKDVKVSCGETTPPQLESISTLPVGVATDTLKIDQEVLWGHWPLIYAASGSFFTILIVIFVLSGYLIYIYRKKRKRRPCQHLSIPTRDFNQDLYDPPYASVRDGTLHLVNPRSFTGHTGEWFYGTPSMRTYQGSTSLRNLRPPAAPPLPPQNECGKSLDTLHQVTPGTSSDVSALEAFLECKEAAQAHEH